ncbi:hypothetical protein MHBO_005297 [Bonamia ostreae]|uniref:RNA methyltransferase n=1 Tax=Bonamia ostreae TaxID=126728 RepID=A0ABV2AJC4_9EUKA
MYEFEPIIKKNKRKKILNLQQHSADSKKELKKATKIKKLKNFLYGNHSNYYNKGYRDDDPRLSMLNKKYFENKSVLDVGCHCGAFTLRFSRKFLPLSVHGVDIDSDLISKANLAFQNLISQLKFLL